MRALPGLGEAGHALAGQETHSVELSALGQQREDACHGGGRGDGAGTQIDGLLHDGEIVDGGARKDGLGADAVFVDDGEVVASTARVTENTGKRVRPSTRRPLRPSARPATASTISSPRCPTESSSSLPARPVQRPSSSNPLRKEPYTTRPVSDRTPIPPLTLAAIHSPL
jgi:hypothetical protein